MGPRAPPPNGFFFHINLKMVHHDLRYIYLEKTTKSSPPIFFFYAMNVSSLTLSVRIFSLESTPLSSFALPSLHSSLPGTIFFE